MRLQDYTDIMENMYRVQGLRAIQRGEPLRGKMYPTFEEARKAALVQAQNATNLKHDNPFVIYKAIAIVGTPLPEPPTTITSYPLERDHE